MSDTEEKRNFVRVEFLDGTDLIIEGATQNACAWNGTVIVIRAPEKCIAINIRAIKFIQTVER